MKLKTNKFIRTEKICLLSDLMGLLWTNLKQFTLFSSFWLEWVFQIRWGSFKEPHLDIDRSFLH